MASGDTLAHARSRHRPNSVIAEPLHLPPGPLVGADGNRKRKLYDGSNSTVTLPMATSPVSEKKKHVHKANDNRQQTTNQVKQVNGDGSAQNKMKYTLPEHANSFQKISGGPKPGANFRK